MIDPVLFLRPAKIKLVFIAEWSAFSVLIWMREGALEGRQIANLLWPLAFYYLAACFFLRVARNRQPMAMRTGYLSLLALGLAGLDHAIKALVYYRLPYGDTIAIIPSHLHLAHLENRAGSWLFAVLGSGAVNMPAAVTFSLVFLMLAPLVHRFYLHNHHRHYWPMIAYIGLTGAVASYGAEMLLRGAIVDYIHLPGVVACDLKDVLLSLGAAAFVAEAIENPLISMRWKGWRLEYRETRTFISRFARFTAGALSGVGKSR